MSKALSLNAEQLDAVEHLEGPLLVLAGAGAGKTRIVTARIARLLELGVAPTSILAVTFTNKAAQEMVERVQALSHQRVLISTFHSLGARILREYITHLRYGQDFVIYDEEDSMKLIKACLDDLGVKSREVKPRFFRSMISAAKQRLEQPEEIDKDDLTTEREKLVPEVYSRYQARLQEYNAVDFDDLLFLTVRLLRTCPDVCQKLQQRWAFILIDEYQDTNEAQYLIAKTLVQKTQNLFVVGDPDQSIYSWRGANIANILNFEQDYPGAKIVRLEQNYRSHNTILRAANQLIGNNQGRYEKNLWSALGDGEPIRTVRCSSEREEADFVAESIGEMRGRGIPLHEIAIFYRTNSQSRQFEDTLLREGIPYVIIGGMSFYQRREIKDILSLLRMVHAGSDFLSFARTINIPKRGIGQVTLEKLRLSAYEQQLPIFDCCAELVVGNGIKLSKRQLDGVTDYVRVIRELRRLQTDHSLAELVLSAIRTSGYIGFLKEDPDSFQDRKENLDALVSKAAEWEELREGGELGDFLEELTLKSSTDISAAHERVNLMTLHNGKGLEFTAVFLTGMEEGLFPHANSFNNPDALEEERRLCYVGITRAKRALYMTGARFRHVWGEPQVMRPSRFLKELPKECVRNVDTLEPYGNSEVADEEPENGAGNFQPGDTVRHNTFGIGCIEEVTRSSLGVAYRVLFRQDRSTKTLIAKYARLTRVVP